MFARFQGGEIVKGGLYISLANGEFVNIPEQVGRLPEKTGARYVAVNPLVALVVGPLFGLAFVIALPAMALVYMGWLAARRVRMATHPRMAVQAEEEMGSELWRREA